jgi:peptide chain release factor subunit 1
MISTSDLEVLMQRPPKPGSPVLSVYLGIDPSRGDNFNRAFEIVLKDMLRDVRQEQRDKDKREEFERDSGRLRRFLEEYREPARGLVVFCDDSEEFFWVREFRIRIRDGLWWHDIPYVRPLIEILDEHERYGLVLTDREHARLFTVFVGEIEEHREAFAKADVTHIKTSGTDHLRSQMNIQRKADEHAHWHLKRVATLMSRFARVYEFDRLILAGTVEATSELGGLLPKALRTRVVRELSLPVEASEKQVLEETLKIEQEVERAQETELVERLITAGSKRNRALLGLDDMLLALQEWRIWELVYADGYAPRGGECTNCRALSSSEADPCPYCGKAVRAVNDLVKLASERVLDINGKVEQVHGAAARRLEEVGSIGVLLRF